MAISISASTITSLNAQSSGKLHAYSSKSSPFCSFPVQFRRVPIGSKGVSSPSRRRILPLVVEAKKETFSSLDDMVANSDKPLLVDFYATWCGPCQFMVPILNEVSTRLKDAIQIVKIDAEKYPAIADQYKIEALPTFIIFKDGKPCDRFEGAFTADKLIAKIENSLKVKQ